MRMVYYTVGNEFSTMSYQDALKRANETGAPIMTRFQAIKERPVKRAEYMAKRKANQNNI